MGNMNAAEFERQRHKYMDQLKEIFEIVRIENSMVQNLVNEGNKYMQDGQELNEQMLRKDFLHNVKKVASVLPGSMLL